MYSIGREFIRTFSTVYSSSASFLSSSSLMHSAAAAAADGRRQQQRRVRRRPRTIGSTGSAESTAILQPATTARPTHPFGTDTCTRPLQTAPRLLFTLGSSRSTPQSRLTMRQKKKINKGDQSFIEFFHWDIVLLKKKSFGFENDGFSLFHNLLDSITCRVCVCVCKDTLWSWNKAGLFFQPVLCFFDNLFFRDVLHPPQLFVRLRFFLLFLLSKSNCFYSFVVSIFTQAKLNCEVLWDDLALEVRWAVAGETIVLQLVGKIGKKTWFHLDCRSN